MEGDTTNFYLFKKIKEFELEVTTLSRGVSVGSELQYADELTLGRSLINRQPFNYWIWTSDFDSAQSTDNWLKTIN